MYSSQCSLPSLQEIRREDMYLCMQVTFVSVVLRIYMKKFVGLEILSQERSLVAQPVFIILVD